MFRVRLVEDKYTRLSVIIVSQKADRHLKDFLSYVSSANLNANALNRLTSQCRSSSAHDPFAASVPNLWR